MRSSLFGRVKSRVSRLLGRGHAYYEDPSAYWNSRHQRFGDKLEGVGTISLAEELNEREYELKWAHVERALVPLRAEGLQTLLDAGCGNGYFTERAHDLGFSVDAVDFSKEAVSIAAAMPNRSGVRWHVSPLHEFSASPAFDLVMTIDVLFHVVDDEIWRASVLNLSSLVAPGGALVVQEHLVPGGLPAPVDGTTHIRWRDESDYLGALGGWKLASHDHYDLPDSESWKDLMVFRRAPAHAG